MMMGGYPGGGLAWLAMTVAMLAVWLLVVGVVVLLVRDGGGRRTPDPPTPPENGDHR